MRATDTATDGIDSDGDSSGREESMTECEDDDGIDASVWAEVESESG